MSNKLLENYGSFLKALNLSSPPLESFDTIRNRMDTIKEYREYIQPTPDSWNDYILQVFQLLGFNTKIELKRLLSLSELGGERSKRAVVVLIRLDEDFRELAPDLEWSTFLYFAMHFFKVEWGLLTDGQKVRIFNRNQNMKTLYLEADLETIISDGNFDHFFAFYELISIIRGGLVKSTEMRVTNSRRQSQKYDLNYHMANKSNTVITLFNVLHAKIKSLSNQVDERFQKLFIGYYINDTFCQICPQKEQLKIWVNLNISQIPADHLDLCRDVRNVGHYGSGDTEINLRSFNDLDAVFEIIRQAYNKSNNHNQHLETDSVRQNGYGLRRIFWTELLEKANPKTLLHANISPGHENKLSAGAGKRGLTYVYVVRLIDAHVELYIDNGDKAWNKSMFDFFYQQKEEIEKSFGAALDWQLLKEKRASKIRHIIYDYGLNDRNHWPALQDLMIDSIIRLHSALQPIINQVDEVATQSVVVSPTDSTQHAQRFSNFEHQSSKRVPQKLINVLMMYEEIFKNNKSYTDAYKELTRRRGLNSEHTILDSCTRALGLQPQQFKKLVNNPDQFSEFLITRFPNHEDYILETVLSAI